LAERERAAGKEGANSPIKQSLCNDIRARPKSNTYANRRDERMSKNIEAAPRATPQISRRVVVQMAPVFPLVAAAVGIASDAAKAQRGYDQAGVKMTQVLRSDLQGQGNQVQESIVTFVEFPPGQGAPMHIHPGAQEIFYVLEGNVTLEQDGLGARVISAGDVALTPADVPHSVRNDGKSMNAKVLVLHSRADKQKPLLLAVTR
jgi:quercetin dioxygenase-like cupin family protein